MKQWLQVHWHALTRILSLKERHQVCYIRLPRMAKRYFCSCGYLNGGKTIDEELADWLYGVAPKPPRAEKEKDSGT